MRKNLRQICPKAKVYTCYPAHIVSSALSHVIVSKCFVSNHLVSGGASASLVTAAAHSGTAPFAAASPSSDSNISATDRKTKADAFVSIIESSSVAHFKCFNSSQTKNLLKKWFGGIRKVSSSDCWACVIQGVMASVIKSFECMAER